MLIPIGVYVPTEGRPWANYGILAITVLVSIVAMTDITVLASFAGLDPATGEMDQHLALSGLTSTLVHGGWLHLAGNMLFLWVFGNAINYKFGQFAYLGLYAFCGWMASMTHYLFNGGPCVGASGAINGLMAAFLVFFPRNDVRLCWAFIPFYWKVFEASAGWVILYWLAWDVTYMVLLSHSPVAHWAHIGGFAAGLAVALPCAALGWIRPANDEQTILQVLRLQK